MSKQTAGLVVDLTIHEGKFDAFETVAQEMIAGSRKEPGTLAYEWYLSGDRQSCFWSKVTPTRMPCWRTLRGR